MGMDRGGGGGDLAAVGEGGLAALRGGDYAARLPDQEHPGGVVPGLEPVLHKAVQAARGQVAQLQRGRADPADVVAAVIEQAHPPEGPVGQLPAAGVGARGAEALPQGGGGADMDGPPAAEGALPPVGSEQLAGVGVVDDAQKDASLLRQSQGDGAVAQVVEQIGGAVHRVQDPNWAGEVHAGVVLLLPHELDLRGQGGQMALQLVLHRGVHGGDEVGGPLAAGLGRQLPAGEERAGLTDGGTELIEQQIGQLEHRKAPIDVMPLRRAERSDWRIPLRRGNINRTWWKKAWSCLPPLAFLPPPHYNNQYNQSSAPKSAFASLRRSGQREERASRPDLNG